MYRFTNPLQEIAYGFWWSLCVMYVATACTTYDAVISTSEVKRQQSDRRTSKTRYRSSRTPPSWESAVCVCSLRSITMVVKNVVGPHAQFTYRSVTVIHKTLDHVMCITMATSQFTVSVSCQACRWTFNRYLEWCGRANDVTFDVVIELLCQYWLHQPNKLVHRGPAIDQHDTLF